MDTNEVTIDDPVIESGSIQDTEENTAEVSLFNNTYAEVFELSVANQSAPVIDINSSKLTFSFDTPLSKTALGEKFIEWLKHRISQHKLKINDKDAKLHIIQGKLFIVSPSIFQRFYNEYPELAKVIDNTKKEHWKVIQSSFEKLKLHSKKKNDLNIWQCTVSAPRKKGQIIKGYLLEPSLFFKEFTPHENPFIELEKEDE
ncbi:DNA-binding domain-containing protein [Entomomonas sp. E2T0]|uniref:conjugal transfer nickase/helicase domain-containing protein n=1 Tax=Entomomonas sp. E2T0 TaxID=2930213 RepID=UPI0022280F4D|nr:DNA-binding domain-containing protein [Entomomonas sp. E2T0]UYZ83120.1 DNA-binding domain-containing protein [Entomomonas sp. E2T0]